MEEVRQVQNGGRGQPDKIEYYEVHPVVLRHGLAVFKRCLNGHRGDSLLDGYWCRYCKTDDSKREVVERIQKPIQWAYCMRCGHRTQLVEGIFCRCGFDGWSSCHCKEAVNALNLIAEPSKALVST